MLRENFRVNLQSLMGWFLELVQIKAEIEQLLRERHVIDKQLEDK